MGQSEVAQLRSRIAAEYEAMRNGLYGFAAGTARHAFIDARMRRVDQYHDQLVKHVGEEAAALTVCDLYTTIIG